MRSDSSDQSAASSLRRRTSCIYCGRRISGVLPVNTGGWNYHTDRLGVHRSRSAAMIACGLHRDLPGLDPDYRERL